MKPLSGVLLVLMLALPGGATTVTRLDLDGLVSTATTIVVGRVESRNTYWTPDRRLILTDYTIAVEDTLKGAVSPTIRFTTIGGTIGDTTLYVAGMPAFADGEETVVFLEEAGRFRTVVGLGQGKFTVENGTVTNDLTDLEFTGAVPDGPIEMQLDVFVDQIQQLLRPF